MKDSRFLLLFQSFSEKERRHLLEFAESPFFSLPAQVRTLIKYCIEHAPHWHSDLFSESAIQTVVWGVGGKTGNNNLFKNIISRAVDALEEFIIHSQLNVKDVRFSTPLFQQLDKHNLPKHYHELIRQMRRNTEQIYPYDTDYYYRNMMIEIFKNTFVREETKKTGEREANAFLDYLDKFYYSLKIGHIFASTQNQLLLKKTTNIPDELEILSKIENSPDLMNVPYIYVSYTLYKVVKGNVDLAQIEELIAYLSAHYSKFLPEDMRAFYASILNYYIRNIQSGKRYLEKHLWNLYQTMMRQGLLFSPEGHIEAATYRNVVSLLIVMENYSEAEMVITTWNRYRQVEHREVMLNHISAFYYFRRENYKESLRFLQKLPPSGQLFETESRQLLIEIYFELQEWEFMYASINSFKAFLRRNKVVNAQRKAMYYNFIKIITQLHGATFGQAVSFKHLKEKIYTLKIPHRQWLEAKYEDLVGKDHS